MNRTGAVIALLVLGAAGFVLYEAFRTRTATLRWDYDYEKNPPCNGGAANRNQKSCVLGFKVFLGTPDNRREQQFVPNQFDKNGQIISKSISWSMPLRSYGSVSFCVVAVGAAGSDQTMESSPLCSTQRVLPFGLGRK
jgi:hypothetical protein